MMNFPRQGTSRGNGYALVLMFQRRITLYVKLISAEGNIFTMICVESIILSRGLTNHLCFIATRYLIKKSSNFEKIQETNPMVTKDSGVPKG